MFKNSYHILETVYGYKEFRPVQKEIIEHVLDGKDALALLPTGGGKSICYQIPGMMLDGLCVVVSPLIALIKDQVTQLNNRGVKAIGLTGGISQTELGDLLDNCVYGQYQFLYLSPERLQQPLVKERLKNMKIGLIAVDEAHCISQWGHDFRPAYRFINELRNEHKQVPLLAVTATATPRVQEDILSNLGIDAASVFKSSFERTNITYQINNTADKRQALLQFYQKHKDTSIIYVRSRKNAVQFSQLLQQNGISASFYHGGLEPKLRTKTADQWMRDLTQVMVATNAFGMGIDKAAVRSVVHIQLPESVESYYQETGRAGRDGLPATAHFIYNVNDITHAQDQFLKGIATAAVVKQVYKKLCVYLQIALGDGMDSIHNFSFSQFCNTYQLPGVQCFNALQVLDRFSIIALSQGFHRRSSVRFRESGTNILQFTGNNPILNAIVQSILRTYGSSTSQVLEVNIPLIAQRSHTTEEQVTEALQTLQEQEMIDATIVNADTQVTMLQPRDDDRTINVFVKDLESQNLYKKQKLDAFITFISEQKRCLNSMLLAYFGEVKNENCGKCSNCILKEGKQELTEVLLSLLKVKPQTLKSMQSQLNVPMEMVVATTQRLLDRKLIKLQTNNTYTLL